MKLPGEAWLEFNIIDKGEKPNLKQTATFGQKGSGKTVLVFCNAVSLFCF